MAHGYYSVVETTTHYFILYAFYHGQDWYDGKYFYDKIRKNFDEHLNDMEGALAIITKKANERVDAFITVSHFHFYTYANWKEDDKKFLYKDPWTDRIRGYKEDLDGYIRPTKHNGRYRFSLYAQAKGHGIRGDRKKWGNEEKIIRYFPSIDTSEEPDDKNYKKENDYYYQEVRYQLINFFERDGLWENKDNPKIFQANKKGQDAFVEPDEEDNNNPVSGSANPPWGWDDIDDRHKCGELAINPANIVHDYLTGLREFSLEYIHNPYLNIFNE